MLTYFPHRRPWSAPHHPYTRCLDTQSLWLWNKQSLGFLQDTCCTRLVAHTDGSHAGPAEEKTWGPSCSIIDRVRLSFPMGHNVHTAWYKFYSKLLVCLTTQVSLEFLWLSNFSTGHMFSCCFDHYRKYIWDSCSLSRDGGGESQPLGLTLQLSKHISGNSVSWWWIVFSESPEHAHAHCPHVPQWCSSAGQLVWSLFWVMQQDAASV